MNDLAIQAQGLGKQYRIGRSGRPGYRTLRESLSRLASSPFRLASPPDGGSETFWALDDVSFEISRGQAVGIIGRNGAGKSTLLKILSRITRPTTGRARIVGRVGSLLEVGTGFHPELTGRENVFLNGAILGMRRAEIARRFDQIVAFAEVERFLETPVKHYSSGMYMRLAFAVAAHLEPEVLIVDEVLAVGDAAFQHKCLGRMQAAAEGGRTVLFVSHNMGAVRNLTQHCIYLQQGRIIEQGPTGAVVDRYVSDALQRAGEPTGDLSYFRRGANPDAAARFLAIRTIGPSGPTAQVPVRSEFGFELDIEVLRSIAAPNISLALKTAAGDVVSHLLSRDQRFAHDFAAGRHTVRCWIRDLHPLPGRYLVDAGINAQPGVLAWDLVSDYPAMEIVNAGESAITFRPDRPGYVLCPDAAWSAAPVTPAAER
jgi:lipopolysaccharide transport system ATP-binding protein